MFCTALYLMVGRLRRIKGSYQFDRSLRGDLKHALAVATYQVNLSKVMRWNALPIGTFILLGILESGKSIWIAVGIFLFLLLASYAGGWEHNIYKTRKRELETLQNKLEKDEPDVN
jgi:hypothetical protein